MPKPEIHSRAPGSNLPARIPRRYGRPRRVRAPEDLPLDFEDQMEEMGGQGLSITEARAALDISHTLWAHWFRHWPEFREVVERFLDLAESWWLNFGRENLGNRFFNAGLYQTQMAMRFKHNRQIQHHLETTGNAQDTQEIDRAEDMRLEDLFSGGDGGVKVKPAADPRQPETVDADWMEDIDRRTVPK